MDSQAPETLGLGVHCRSPGFPHLLLVSYISSLQTQESSATWYCLATVRLNRIFSFSLFFLWRAVVMSRGYSSLLRERRLLELVLNTHIGMAAKRQLPPLLLWEVTIRQLHSGKTKRKALLRTLPNGFTPPNPMHEQIPFTPRFCFGQQGWEFGWVPGARTGWLQGDGADVMRMHPAGCLLMPRILVSLKTPVMRPGWDLLWP